MSFKCLKLTQIISKFRPSEKIKGIFCKFQDYLVKEIGFLKPYEIFEIFFVKWIDFNFSYLFFEWTEDTVFYFLTNFIRSKSFSLSQEMRPNYG